MASPGPNELKEAITRSSSPENGHDKTGLVACMSAMPSPTVILPGTVKWECKKQRNGQQEQLEHMRSEDTPTAPWLLILLASSYWIPSPYYWPVHIGSQAHTIDQFMLDPKSKQGKVKVTNLKSLPKVKILEFWNNLYTAHTFWSC